MEGFDYQKLAFYIDCVGKCKFKYWLTICLRSCDMNAIVDACKLTMIYRVANRVYIAW